MKLRLSIILTLFCMQVSAQVFAPLGAEWTFMGVKSSISPPCETKNIFTYEVTGQVQRNGKTVNVLESGSTSFYYYEDSSKVYFLENDSFYLLTDFSVLLGDTLYNRIPENVTDFGYDCACPPGFIGDVISVPTWDSILVINGDSLRTILFEAFTDTSDQIERVGNYAYTEKLGALYPRFIKNRIISDGKVFGPLMYPVKGCLLGFCCNEEKLCYSDDSFSYDFSINSQNCIYTSVSELFKDDINTYPNPVNDTWFIQSEKSASVQFYELSGKQILQTQIQTGTNAVGFSGLNAGVFLYRIVNEDGDLIKSGKVVKSN